MNQDIKKLWITALRGDAYQQATGALREELYDANDYDDAGNPSGPVKYAHCCLGVLCDLHSKATGMKWDDATDQYYETGSILPRAVADWAGIEDEYRTNIFNPSTVDIKVTVENPEPETEDDTNEDFVLSELNDDGYTFSEIADLIEAQL